MLPFFPGSYNFMPTKSKNIVYYHNNNFYSENSFAKKVLFAIQKIWMKIWRSRRVGALWREGRHAEYQRLVCVFLSNQQLHLSIYYWHFFSDPEPSNNVHGLNKFSYKFISECLINFIHWTVKVQSAKYPFKAQSFLVKGVHEIYF